MSKFSDMVQADTPRLVVMFKKDGDSEHFQWGMVGQLPLLHVIGYIGEVQTGLRNLDLYPLNDCPEQAVVVAWDRTANSFQWFAHHDIPVDSLCGMLEVVKDCLVSSQLARQVAANQVGIVGADGRPVQKIPKIERR